MLPVDFQALITSVGIPLTAFVLIRIFFRRGKAYNQPPADAAQREEAARRAASLADTAPRMPTAGLERMRTARVAAVPQPNYGRRFQRQFVLIDRLFDTLGVPTISPALLRAIPRGPRSLPVPPNAPRAHWVGPSIVVTALLLAIGVAAWLIYHLSLEGTYAGEFRFSYLFMAVVFVLQQILAYAERPKRPRGPLPDWYATILVPLYNEDPQIVVDSLASMFSQSRPPNAISVVDDGSNATGYDPIITWAMAEAGKAGIRLEWQRKRNRGKRHAQVLALEAVPQTQKVGTVDSDATLDVFAVEEGLKGFSDPKVKSVAGVFLPTNNQQNWLTRITDLLFTVSQLTDRSAMSFLGSVLVNSGALAFYDADIIRRNATAYVNEDFGPMPVKYSDDSLLTLYAKMEGKTIQQPTAFVFSTMPNRRKHHHNQQKRWTKGAFIRAFWRLKYLPIGSPGFVRQFLGWMQIVLSSFIFVTLIVVDPIFHGKVIPLWQLLVIPSLIAYGLNLRYWAFRRSDMSIGSQLLTYLMTPLATLWSMTYLRFWKYIWIATVFRGGEWGTREGMIEVTADEPPQQPPQP
jgi:hyaluronan synthase